MRANHAGRNPRNLWRRIDKPLEPMYGLLKLFHVRMRHPEISRGLTVTKRALTDDMSLVIVELR